MSIFGRFGEWGSVLRPPVKPTTYRLQSINFERRFGNLKSFPTLKLTGVLPARMWKFLDVSEADLTYYALRESLRLTICKISTFKRRFGKIKNFPTVKINGRSPGREVTIFGSFGVWGSVLYPPAQPTAYRLQNMNCERRFGNRKNFPTVKLNGRSPVREVTIFGRFRAWGSVLYPPAKPTAYRLQNIKFERRFDNLKFFTVN